MNVRLSFLTLALLPVFALAQKVETATDAGWTEIPAQQTQSEFRAGWKIVDYRMKDKHVRYLSGGRALQMAKGWRPTFRVTPGNEEVLVDYALIRLKQNKYFRKFSKEQLTENDYVRLEPSAFDIRAEEDAFVCRPRRPLRLGEYVIVCLTQKPIGHLQDWLVYPFSVTGLE